MVPALTLEGEALDAIGADDTVAGATNAIEPAIHPEEYLSLDGAARCFGQGENEVLRQIQDNHLVALPRPDGSYSIPAAQFHEGTVMPGIPEVLGLFAHEDPVSRHQAAWAFLRSDLFVGDPCPRPIDMLRSAITDGSTREALAQLELAKKSLDYGDHY